MLANIYYANNVKNIYLIDIIIQEIHGHAFFGYYSLVNIRAHFMEHELIALFMKGEFCGCLFQHI